MLNRHFFTMKGAKMGEYKSMSRWNPVAAATLHVLTMKTWILFLMIMASRMTTSVNQGPGGDYLQLFVNYLKLFVFSKIIGIICGLFVQKCSVFS